ncbi:MAG TPA: hypothetical protein ENI97_13640 [Gammaproteobacteria bacterium]|nr:hypothetical protein [Gammaproteobacteria bacterium]
MAVIILAVYALYWPAVPGPFMFDDWVNLSLLGAHKKLGEFQQVLIFITREGTSFIDRPLSRLSFYLNDHAWPSSPEGFRLTNITIHALNSILIWWLSLRLLKLFRPNLSSQTHLLLPFVIALIWAIHPIQVNAVAYIIQRMTLLSGTFVLAGLITYTYGRESLATEPYRGVILMSLAIVVFMPLAFLSKQNGILMPLFIAATEFTLFRQTPGHKTARRWSIPFVLGPVVLVLSALSIRAQEKVFSWYDAQPFTPLERVLTESRILFDYLAAIFLPQAHTSTLFHDNYPISHSLLSPPSTLPAVLGILALTAIAVFGRKRMPLLAFACGWYIVGHLLESSIIGLELYYEHRNYIPLFGPVFALVYATHAALKEKPAAALGLATTFTALLAFITLMNTSVWHTKESLISNWYKENPKSLRTANLMVGLLNERSDYVSARTILQQSAKEWPRNPQPPLLTLLLDCVNNRTGPDSLEKTLSAIPKNYAHSNIVLDILEKLHAPVTAGYCPPLTLDDLERIVQHLLMNPNTKRADASRKWRTLTYNLYFLQARIASEQRNLNKAMQYADKANEILPNPNLMILQAAWLSSAGLYEEALQIARRALTLSREKALFDALNPYEENLQSLISNIEKQARTNTP